LDVETALTAVQLNHHINHRTFSDSVKLSEYVLHLAKAIAQAPFKSVAIAKWKSF